MKGALPCQQNQGPQPTKNAPSSLLLQDKLPRSNISKATTPIPIINLAHHFSQNQPHHRQASCCDWGNKFLLDADSSIKTTPLICEPLRRYYEA